MWLLHIFTVNHAFVKLSIVSQAPYEKCPSFILTSLCWISHSQCGMLVVRGEQNQCGYVSNNMEASEPQKYNNIFDNYW